MSATILLGYTDDGRAVRLPSDAITQTIALLARKEGGKTYAGMLLAEGMLDLGGQVVVVDSIGKWWALCLGADGHARGKDIFVLGGKHGHAPLHPDAGKLVAHAIVEGHLSVVLDLSHMRKGQRIRFLADFAEEFLFLKQQQDAPIPAHVFLEEAQRIMPQMGREPGPDERRMLGAFEDIVRVGRNAGIGVTMISQRPQSVNKEALSQTELLVALGVNEKPARKTIHDWVEEKGAMREEVVGELPGLAQGEAFVWSPSWLRFFGKVKIARKSTYDSSATAKLGRRRAVGRLPKADVKALVAAMGEEGMKKLREDDPKALKIRIAELERALAAKAPPAPKVVQGKTVVKTETKEIPVVSKKVEKLLVALAERAKGLAGVASAAVKINAVVERIAATLDATKATPATGKTKTTTRDVTLDGDQPRPPGSSGRVYPGTGAAWTPPRPLKTLTIDREAFLHGEKGTTPRNGATAGEAPSEYALGLLQTLAQRAPMALTRTQVALLSGRSQGSSTFATAMAEITKKGLITPQGGRFTLTDAGTAIVGTPPAPRTPEETREMWLRALPDYERDLLKVLIACYPEAITREALAERAGKSMNSSTFATAISTLCKNEIVVVPERGFLQASPTLF